MSVKELNHDQICELKQAILCQRSMEPTWSEIANPDSFVSDEEVYAAFKDFTFSPDDFFCA